MTTTVSVTAAIAACDRPAGLLRCVRAILQGPTLPAELVVVDQSRSDEIGRLLAAEDVGPVRLAYLRQPRRGLAASRNAAVVRATCPVIAFTDDDCVPAPDWIAVASRLETLPEPIAALSGRVLALEPPSPDSFAVSLRESTTARNYRGRHPPWQAGTGGNFAARRDWLTRVAGFDERLGAGSPGRAAEDADLIYRLLRAGATVRYEPDALVYHARQSRGQRLTSRFSYAYGLGTFCGLWLSRGDMYPGLLLGVWTLRQGRSLATSLLRGDWFLARQRMLSLRGSVGGLGHGLAEAAVGAWRGWRSGRVDEAAPQLDASERDRSA